MPEGPLGGPRPAAKCNLTLRIDFDRPVNFFVEAKTLLDELGHEPRDIRLGDVDTSLVSNLDSDRTSLLELMEIRDEMNKLFDAEVKDVAVIAL